VLLEGIVTRKIKLVTDEDTCEIEIPDEAKLTFGPLVPKHHLNVLRIYIDKEIIATFKNIESFYDMSKVRYVERVRRIKEPTEETQLERRITPVGEEEEVNL